MAMAIRNMVTPTIKMNKGRPTMTMTMVMATTTDRMSLALDLSTLADQS